MEISSAVCFFAGVYAPEGYYSLHCELTEPEKMQAVHIIKGATPAQGAQFLQRVMQKISSGGAQIETFESVLNRGDTEAVLLPERGVLFADGRPPHTLDAYWPGAPESYIDLGQFCDASMIQKNRVHIREGSRRAERQIRAAARCLRAADALEDNVFNLCAADTDYTRLTRRTAGIIRREIPRRRDRSGPGRLVRRFLSAVTPQGYICRFDTIRALCPRVYELSDSYGLSHFPLAAIKDAALEAGYDVILGESPRKPGTKIDHLLIPALGLALLTGSPYAPYPGTPYRRIRLDNYVNPEVRQQHAENLRSLRRQIDALDADAAMHLTRAAEEHTALERLYADCTDMDALLGCADTYAARYVDGNIPDKS